MILRLWGKWLVALAVVAMAASGLWFYKTSPQRDARARIVALKAQLETAQAEVAKLNDEYPPEKLEETRKKAVKARETLHPMAEWAQLQEKITNAGIQPVVNTSPLGANMPKATHIDVTLPFKNLPADKQHVDKIAELLRELDTTFGGCQHVVLALPQPSGTSLPRGQFSDDSEAVYSFNVALPAENQASN